MMEPPRAATWRKAGPSSRHSAVAGCGVRTSVIARVGQPPPGSSRSSCAQPVGTTAEGWRPISAPRQTPATAISGRLLPRREDGAAGSGARPGRGRGVGAGMMNTAYLYSILRNQCFEDRRGVCPSRSKSQLEAPGTPTSDRLARWPVILDRNGVAPYLSRAGRLMHRNAVC